MILFGLLMSSLSIQAMETVPSNRSNNNAVAVQHEENYARLLRNNDFVMQCCENKSLIKAILSNDKLDILWKLKARAVLPWCQETYDALKQAKDRNNYLLGVLTSDNPRPIDAEIKIINILRLIGISVCAKDVDLGLSILSRLSPDEARKVLNTPCCYESKPLSDADKLPPVPPLTCAAIRGDNKWAQLCVNYGVNVNQLTMEPYADEATAMDYAAAECIDLHGDELLEHLQLVEYLNAHGGKCTGDHEKAFKLLKKLYKVIPCKKQNCEHICKRCEDKAGKGNARVCCHSDVALRHRSTLKEQSIRGKLNKLYMQ